MYNKPVQYPHLGQKTSKNFNSTNIYSQLKCILTSFYLFHYLLVTCFCTVLELICTYILFLRIFVVTLLQASVY